MDFIDQISQRRVKLKADRKVEEQRFAQRIAGIDSKLAECDTAERVWREMNSGTGAQATDKARKLTPFTGTHKALTLKIVRDAYPKGMLSRKIIGIARRKYGVALNPYTLTVNMGLHKADGVVRLNGKKWHFVKSKITKTLGKEDASTDESAEASGNMGVASGDPLRT